MAEIRLCVLCDAQIDIEAEGVKVLTRRGGHGRRLTIQDKDGRIHVVREVKQKDGGRTASRRERKMRTAADVNQDRADTAHAVRVEQGLWQVFNAFPDLVVCDANASLIRSWCSAFSGTSDAVPTVALFSAARDANREEWRKAFVLRPIAQQLSGLIDEIIEMLRTGGSHTPETLRAERNKISYFNRDQLLARRAEVQRKQSFNKLPLPDLKQKLAGFREAEERAERNVLPPEWTSERLRNNVELVKHCVRKFGVDATNARLQGES